MTGRKPGTPVLLLIPLLFWTLPCVRAGARRVVVLKADGVPADLLEQLIGERDARTGKSRLPWIDEVFVRSGTRLANFYVRGISLSAPSWAMLDTGQHQIIHGNVEYDRFTLRSYDYMNFFPFYTRHPLLRVDMPGVETLDEAGVPLLIDRFAPDDRFQSLELYQRGHRWRTLEHTLPNRLFSRSPRELFDEWQSGLELAGSVDEQAERELLNDIATKNFAYLDYFSGDFDHIAHLTNDRESQARMLAKLDALVGRVWDGIRRSPLAEQTVLVLVSDHGMNTSPGVFSQGYSLLDWFGGAEGGGHHSITNRHPLSEYKIRGLNPLVSEVVTPGAGAAYLKGEEQQYPTAMFDLDGNERAAVQLRSNTLNVLHILLQQMNRRELSPQVREASIRAFFLVLDRHRSAWERSRSELHEELEALGRAIHRQPAAAESDSDSQRRAAHAVDWEQEQRAYGEYLRVLSNLLSLRRERFDPREARISELIPRRSMGPANALYDLENYVVGVAANGVALLSSDPACLDLDRSFRRINYLSALQRIRVRNNVQQAVGPAPVDFVAVPLPPEQVAMGLAASGIEPDGENLTQAILLHASDDREALALVRKGANGLDLRYLPVQKVEQSEDGAIQVSAGRWMAGLPLQLWEDPNLRVPDEDRDGWLTRWHPEREWMRATHQTRYSNGLIGITEQFTQSPGIGRWFMGASADDRMLLERLEARRRRLVAPDMLIFASDHWNFNVRNFNPGGNHGSFFRISTHSVLMFAGGDQTGVPQGLRIEEPYDSLSFVPTILGLLDRSETSGPRALPGPVIDALSQP